MLLLKELQAQRGGSKLAVAMDRFEDAVQTSIFLQRQEREHEITVRRWQASQRQQARSDVEEFLRQMPLETTEQCLVGRYKLRGRGRERYLQWDVDRVIRGWPVYPMMGGARSTQNGTVVLDTNGQVWRADGCHRPCRLMEHWEPNADSLRAGLADLLARARLRSS